jgi:hypothetical protein
LAINELNQKLAITHLKLTNSLLMKAVEDLQGIERPADLLA